MSVDTTHESICRLALSLTPGMGAATIRLLLRHTGSAQRVFETDMALLQQIPYINKKALAQLGQANTMQAAEKEWVWMLNNHIRLISYNDPDYPAQLQDIPDAPPFLFVKGAATLTPARSVAVVGTRTPSHWSRSWIEQFINDLIPTGATIISGMAMGIDSYAHKAAVEYGLPTIAVLGHGLDRIYPANHRNLADRLLQQGGTLLTEFPSGIKPAKENFPMRNRIIAALADAVVIVESGETGGSMITAKNARKYRRRLYAVPGRPQDAMSAGCLQLIQNREAHVITDARTLISDMQWGKPHHTHQPAGQPLLFDLAPDETAIVEALRIHSPMHIDALRRHLPALSAQLPTLLLQLEIQNIIATLPGKHYKLVTG